MKTTTRHKVERIKHAIKGIVIGGTIPMSALAGMIALMMLPYNMSESDAIRKAGVKLMRQGKTDEAVAYLRKSVEMNPRFNEDIMSDENAHFALSMIYWKMWQEGRKTYKGEDTKKMALESIHKAMIVNPRSGEFRVHTARILADSDIDEAIAHAREAVKLYPANPRRHAFLGNLLIKAGEKEEAQIEYREAIRLNKLVREPWLKIRVKGEKE